MTGSGATPSPKITKPMHEEVGLGERDGSVGMGEVDTVKGNLQGPQSNWVLGLGLAGRERGDRLGGAGTLPGPWPAQPGRMV